MSKERAIRRAEREREAAIKAAARAAEAERRERRAARTRALKAPLPRVGVGRHQGVLARRRRIQRFVVLDLLVVFNIVVWFTTDSWSLRLLVLIASVLCFPVLATVPFRR